MTPLKLAALEAPLEPVEFPNGTTHAVVPFDGPAYEMWLDLQHTGNDDTAMALLRRCVPTATAADLDTLTPTMIGAIIAHAQRKLQLVLDNLDVFRGNVRAGGATPRSRPRTTSVTSARGSRTQRGKGSGRPSASRTTKRSSRT